MSDFSADPGELSDHLPPAEPVGTVEAIIDCPVPDCRWWAKWNRGNSIQEAGARESYRKHYLRVHVEIPEPLFGWRKW